MKKEKISAICQLSNDHAKKDKFITALDENTAKYLLSKNFVFLTSDKNGYITLDEKRIKVIYSRIDSYENYMELLSYVKEGSRYIGPMSSNSLNEALYDSGFKVEREHHQLIKNIKSCDASNQHMLELEPLKDFSSDEILQVIKNEVADTTYTLKEIDELKKSKFSFSYENLNAIVIAYPNKDFLYLEQIVVKENMQGKGIGKNVLYTFESLAKEKFNKVSLHVYSDNKVAYSLYLKANYELDKIIAYWER